MEKCKHLSLLWGGLWYGGGYYATCGACGSCCLGKTIDEVQQHFYPQEKTMSADYDAGYKAGVEKATEQYAQTELTDNTTRGRLLRNSEDYCEFLYHLDQATDRRRKNLLTKKVTKYAVACSRSRGDGYARAYFVYDDLFDGKNFAELKAKQISETDTASIQDLQVHGVFPIEIEIPL